jgi:signal transduction histidine kinase
VRRRLALLVAAAMALVLVAFLVPLAVLVRRVAAERAVAAATTRAQSLTPLVAAGDQAALRLSIDQLNAATSRPVTVYLADGTVLGPPATRTPAVELAARRGMSFSVADPAGREIVVSVQGLPGGTAVIRTFVPAAELRAGVTRAWVTLAVIGLVLLLLGVALADRLAVTLVRPIRALAAVSTRLAGGDLAARAAPGGTAEIRGVALALNHLAGRIRELLDQEREAVADLSHRMRTPLTALRLDAESLRDPEEAARIVAHVATLDRAVTGLIEDARHRPAAPGAAAPAGADASEIVAARAAFWRVLAEDQNRTMQLSVAPGPVWVALPPADLAACVDALLGNVFAHTEDGVAFEVHLEEMPNGARLIVGDAGAGLGDPERLRRGVSGAGSSGLGLDIARQAATVSGGSLTLGASPLGGAQVQLTLGAPEP